MAQIKGVKLEQKYVDQMKGKLRKADIRECECLGFSADFALQYSLDNSQMAWAGIKEDDEAFIAFGAGTIPSTILQKRGLIWMLATDRLEMEKDILKALARRSVKYVDQMLNTFDLLSNYVMSDNEIAIHWLEWLGAEFENEQPLGINGELYRQFYIRRD